MFKHFRWEDSSVEILVSSPPSEELEWYIVHHNDGNGRESNFINKIRNKLKRERNRNREAYSKAQKKELIEKAKTLERVIFLYVWIQLSIFPCAFFFCTLGYN